MCVLPMPTNNLPPDSYLSRVEMFRRSAGYHDEPVNTSPRLGACDDGGAELLSGLTPPLQ
jgi:hypothetical protein